MEKNSRRSFLQQSSVLAGGSLLLSAFESYPFNYSKRIAAADQINVGAIGLNGMGWSDLSAALKLPGVNVVALCDVDKRVLDKRMKELADKKIDTARIKTYGDYRKL